MLNPNIRNILIVVFILLLAFHYENSRVSWLKRFALRESQFSNRQLHRVFFGKIKEDNEPAPWVTEDQIQKDRSALTEMVNLQNDRMQSVLSLSAKVERLEAKLEHVDDMLGVYKSFIPGIHVASSQGKSNIISELQITNEEKYRNTGTKDSNFYLGSLDGHNVKRSLLKVEHLSDILPPKAKILSAVLHLKICKVYRIDAMGASINFHSIKKSWAMGQKDSNSPTATWDISKPGVPWKTPGLWDPEDVDTENISASMKGLPSPYDDEWVEVYFTKQGIQELQSILKDEPHNGWLLKLDRDDIPSSRVCFYYTDSRGRPYLEIFYKIEP